MSEDPNLPAPKPPTQERRDITIEALSSLFAAGRLEMEEFEARVERALRAQTVADLDALVSDLAPTGSHTPVTTPIRAGEAVDRPRLGQRLTVAVMAGTNREGRWAPAQRHVGVALMGGVEIDFREAVLQPGTTDVYLFAMWGGIDVIVPPGLEVEVGGVAVMGGLGRISERSDSTGPRRPRLHIHALALMGAIDAEVRYPGESAKEARRRRKRLKRGADAD